MSIKVQAAPATTAPTPAAVHPNLIVLTKKQKEFLKHHAPLAEGIAMVNGLLSNGEEGAFPPTWPVLQVRAHLLSELATLMARDAAGTTRRAAVEADLSAGGSIEDVLKRLGSIVDGTYEPGEPGRSDFFPPPGPERSESERLNAMIAGAVLHNLLLPADLALPILTEMATKAAADETARAEAELAHQNKSTAGSNLRITTRTIRVRLGKIIRGRCGRYSTKLAEYGLKVPKKPIWHRRKKAAAGDTPTEGSAQTEAKGKGGGKPKSGGKPKNGEEKGETPPPVDGAVTAGGATEGLEKK